MDDSFLLNPKIVDKLIVGIIYFDPSGLPIYANRAAERIFGLKLNELHKLTAPSEDYLIINFDGETLATGMFPTELVLKTGKPVKDHILGIQMKKISDTTWVIMEAEPEFEEDGTTIKRVLATVTNISTQINNEQQLRFQNKLQNLILKTAKTYLGVIHNNPELAVNQSLEDLAHFLEADRAYIFEYDYQYKLSNNTYEWCKEGVLAHKDDMQFVPFSIVEEWLTLHSQGKPIHIPDVNGLPLNSNMKNALDAQSILSLLTVPIMYKTNCVGFVGIDFVGKKHYFTDQEQNLLVIFAELYSNMSVRIEYTKQIRESEEQLQSIVNSPTHYVLRTNLLGEQTFWNKTYETEFGWLYDKTGIAKTNSLISICDYHHEKTKAIFAACIATPGSVHQIELDKPAFKGGIITSLWEFVCLTDENGKPAEIQCMGIDITAKKAIEDTVRKLSRAVEQIPLTIIITNLDGNIEYANPYVYTSTGYYPEELIGKNTRIFNSGTLNSSVYQQLWKNITQGKDWKGVLHNKKKDGTLYWEQSTIGPILNEEGDITHYIAIKEDITEQKRIQDELKDLNLNLEQKIKERTFDLENVNLSLINAMEEVQKANKAKIDFLSKMSHELRTPMNSILGFGQLLELGDLNTVQKKNVQHIIDSGTHLLNLINEILDISKIESGKISVFVEPIEIHGVINEINETLLFAAAKKGISIHTKLNDIHPIFVKADKQRLNQVLINIINNAIKYNNEGGEVKISATLRPISENGYIPVRISVADNGWGIEEKDLEIIFKPFERLNAEDSGAEGSGLGLTVVKQLVELMGGTVGVKSSLGKGSEFWIELQQSDSPLELIEKRTTTIIETTNHLKGTVIYIEDNLMNVELVKEIISRKRKGINLIIYKQGNGAIEKIIECKPDLILLDLNLPGKSGKKILEELQFDSATKDIPVVVVSASAMPNHIKFIKSLGAKKYLTKPIEIGSFLKAVDEFIK